MKKIVNFRPFVLFALSIIAGILLATFVFVSENLKLVFFCMFLVFSLCGIILAAIFKTKFLKYVIVCLLLVSIPIGQIFHKHHEFNKNENYDSQEFVISGRICSNYKFTNAGNLGFVIDEVEVIGADFKAKMNGKVQIYTNPANYDLSELEIGKFISAFGKINVNNFNDDSKYAISNISNEIVASCFVNYSNFEFKDKTKLSLDERVRNSVFKKLNSFEIEYSEIGYAMMFGDSTMIDEDVVSAFRTTGIAHILAVSGLHVSLVAMIVSFVLKLLKCPKKANVMVMAVVLLIYAYLCDFSVSVVRASLMTLMYLYFKARGKCYDRLSALAFSACVILLAKPMKLFNVSFILSFMAVLSIILLENVFERLLNKAFHKKFSGTLALIFAVQVGLVFVQLYFFKKYTPLSIVCNFISIPVTMISFYFLVAGTVMSYILPFMSFAAAGYDYLMSLVVKFNYTLSKARLAFAVNNLNFLIVIFGAIIIILLSDYIFMKKRYKAAGVSLFMILGTILLIV